MSKDEVVSPEEMKQLKRDMHAGILISKRRQFGINTFEDGSFAYLLQPSFKYKGWNLLTVMAPDNTFVTCLVGVTESLLDTDIVGWVPHATLDDIPDDETCFFTFMAAIGDVIDEKN